MTSGHKSGGAQQRFDANSYELVVVMLIEQHQLIEQHGPQRQELAAAQALDRHLAAPLKDVLEQAIERFDRLGAQLMKYPSDFDSAIGMGIGSPAGRYQFAVVLGTLKAEVRSIVMLVAQDITDLGGQLGEQPGCHVTVGDIGEGKLGSQGNPETTDRHRQMQLPAIPPAMPAPLAPVRLGSNGRLARD